MHNTYSSCLIKQISNLFSFTENRMKEKKNMKALIKQHSEYCGDINVNKIKYLHCGNLFCCCFFIIIMTSKLIQFQVSISIFNTMVF